MRFVIGKEFILEVGEAEEVALFFHGLDRLLVDRTEALGGRELFLGIIGLAGDTIEALVVAEVEVAAILDRRPELLGAALVALLRGADEVVGRAAEPGPGRSEFLGDPVGVGLGIHPFLRGDALDLEAVLVRPGEEARVFAAEAVVAREHVGRDRGVSAPEVGNVVDVIDRCGDVEGVAIGGPAF